MEIEIASVLGTMCDQFTNMSGVDIGTIGKGRLHDPHTHIRSSMCRTSQTCGLLVSVLVLLHGGYSYKLFKIWDT